MLNAVLEQFAASALGQFRVKADLSWDHGESAVWHLQGEAGEVVLKSHRQKRKFDQELHANRQWLPDLTNELRAPGLIDWQAGPVRSLLFEFVPGTLLQDLQLEAPREAELHRMAGRSLAALHGSQHEDTDTLPLADAFARRLEAWSARAQGTVPAGTIKRVADAALEAVPLLEGRRRVPCHRDYTPRNWLVTGSLELFVIDFEHSRPDLNLLDLERLLTGLWRHRPDLQEAFLDGYGQQLSADETALLRRCAALGALSTVVWAREHADAEFEAHGWDVLEWLGLSG